MHALVISDFHASTTWRFSHPLPDGRPSRFQDLLDVLGQVERALEIQQPSDLLILGDCLHRRHFISWRLINPLWDALHRLAERVSRTMILVGNHDYEDDATHGLYLFNTLPNTIVVDRPQIHRLASGEEIFALPYLHDAMAVAAAVEQAPALPVFGHYGAEGCELTTDYWLESPLKAGALGRFPLTVFGHIHKPSEQFGGRIWYVGAVMQFDFGDTGPRGGLVIEDGLCPTRLSLQAPVFETARWPKIPAPVVLGRDFLRILEVPVGRALEAQEWAQELGWVAAVALEEILPPETQEAVAQGLVVSEATLVAYVQRACPTWTESEVRQLAADGWVLLQENA